MRFICFLILVAIGAAVGYFVYQNHQEVTVTLYDRTWTGPLAGVAAVAYGLGMLTGWSLLGLLRRSFNRVTEYRDDRYVVAR